MIIKELSNSKTIIYRKCFSFRIKLKKNAKSKYFFYKEKRVSGHYLGADYNTDKPTEYVHTSCTSYLLLHFVSAPSHELTVHLGWLLKTCL